MKEQFYRFALSGLLATGLAFCGAQGFAQQDNSAQQPSSAEAAGTDDIQNGRVAFEAHDFQQAIRLFSDAIEFYTERLADPALSATEKSMTYCERGVAYDDRAYTYEKLSHFDLADENNAVADYGAAVKADPKNAEAYRARAADDYDTNGMKDGAEKAIADYTTALELNALDAKETAETYDARAGYYAREKSTIPEAVADYSSALRFNPQDADVFYARGRLYDEEVHRDLAAADYSSALQLVAGAPGASVAGDAHYRRGEDEDQAGRHDLAIADFTAAIAIKDAGWRDPNDNIGYAYGSRAKDEEREGRYELAIADCTTIIELNLVAPEETAAIYKERGDDYDHIGQHKEAAADHREFKEIKHDLRCNQEGEEACSVDDK